MRGKRLFFGQNWVSVTVEKANLAGFSLIIGAILREEKSEANAKKFFDPEAL